MASTNQSPFYKQAEVKFLSAQTDEEKLVALEEMIKECPKHKSSEKMLANLKTRYKKLKQEISKSKSSGKSNFRPIKKEDMQAVIIGFSNSGKSALLKQLTNAKPIISDKVFTTQKPIPGSMSYANTNIQLIEIPAVKSERFDRGLVNSADTIIIIVTELNEIKDIEESLGTSKGKRIIAYNKIDLLDSEEKRKLQAQLDSKFKKYPHIIISTKTREGLEKLKGIIFQSFGKLRVFTKSPNEKEKSPKPIILSPGDTIKTVAQKVFKTSHPEKIVKQTKIWGPSSKFAGQIVGLNHIVKDLDTVEFKTK